jgi:hypothetical protein
MPYNPYTDRQPVYITDPSGRLTASGIQTFNFPYTPTVSSIINTNYSSAATTHSNYQQAFFESAANASFTVTAPILIENQAQGRHILKALNFFRGSMKMRFGKEDDQRGLPPPVLRFFAHGVHTNVPVLITDFTYNLDSDVSYIEIDDEPAFDTPPPLFGGMGSSSASGGSDPAEQEKPTPSRNESSMKTRLPVSGMFVMSLITTYSPKSVRENFTLDKYLKGELKGQGYV